MKFFLRSKHLLMALFLCLVGISGASAKSQNEIRIYINPGHGSWGPDNRPQQTIGRAPYNSSAIDTTGFFESKTNLNKALTVLWKLHDLGVPFDPTKNQTNSNPNRVGAALDLSQNLVMSHVKIGPWPYTGSADDSKNDFNRTLSEVAAEVEHNNFDLFLSIHSDAVTEGSIVNSPLMLYRGTDAAESASGSKAFAQAIFPRLLENQNALFSSTNTNIRGDLSFYKSSGSTSALGYTGYLAVLKHGVCGVLSEGYCHTYQPSRQRYLNKDVCAQEGVCYARAIADYMGWSGESTGYIYGIVRDKHEYYTQALYTPQPGTNDIYKPLNGVTVILKQNGTELKRYVTDNDWNGAFVFSGLAPGTYTLEYSAPGYKSAESAYTTVTVSANKTSYMSAFLEATNYDPAAAVNTYYDPLANSSVTLQSSYTFEKKPEDTTLSSYLSGKTIRRQIVRNGKLYVLALDSSNEPYIYEEDLATTAVRQISTSGTDNSENRTLKLADIAFTADDYLIGCSYGINQIADANVASGQVRGSVAIYKWNLSGGVPSGDPVKWFTSQNSGNYYQAYVGNTLAYSGSTSYGNLMLIAQTTGSTAAMRPVQLSVVNNTLSGTTYMLAGSFNATALGVDYRLDASPNGDNKFVIDGSSYSPYEWTTAGNRVEVPVDGTMTAAAYAENYATFFKYAGRSMMVVPTITDGNSTGLRLYDVTNGFASPTLISTNTTVDAASYVSYTNHLTAAGRPRANYDSDGNVTDGGMDLYLVRDGKVTVFTNFVDNTEGVRAEFAYDLRMTGTSSDERNTYGPYTLKFKSTGDAPNATIILRNVDNASDVIEIPYGNVVKGDNEFTLYPEDYNLGIYNWEVKIDSKPITSAHLVFDKTAGTNSTSTRGGVAFMRDTESNSFGKIVVSQGYAQGLDVYSPTLEKLGTYHTDKYNSSHKASPYRVAHRDGKAYIADWSDPYSGITVFDPENPSALTSFFNGTRGTGGVITNASGTVIAGNFTSVDFAGEGASTKMYGFCEDYPTANSKKVVRYDIGAAETWASAPNAQFDAASALLLNANVETLVTDKGVFFGQVRGSGNNNTGVPAFIFMDNAGNITYNSGNDTSLTAGGSGMAISDDGTLFALSAGVEGVHVYRLGWSGTTPTFAKLYTLPNSSYTDIYQLDFDHANNLYGYHYNTSGFSVWSLPNTAPTAVTPAKKSYRIFAVPSGVEETQLQAQTVKVYPNPATSVVNISATYDIQDVQLYSMSGALVKSGADISGNTATMNVDNLPAGTYLLKVDSKTVKLIKK